MKKLILFAVMALIGSVASQAQYPEQFYPIQAKNFGIKGGKNGKIYQIIVKNDKSKKELIQKTTAMLEAFKLMGDDVKLDEVNDQMSEYKVSVVFNTGVGIHPSDAVPVRLYGDLRFEFYDGGVKLTLENLTEEFFILHYHPENITEKGTETYQKYNEFIAKAREVEKATSGMGKFFAKVDKLQEINHISGTLSTFGKNAKTQVVNKINEANAERLNTLIKYRERIDEQLPLYDKMVKLNEGRWYTAESYVADAKSNETFMKYKSAAEWNLKGYAKALENEQLYDVDKKRWERDIKYVYDGIFITLAEELEGSIVGIAEDGVLTWEREGDLVVPTDAKKKAKYIKKNKSFTDYDSYDN